MEGVPRPWRFVPHQVPDPSTHAHRTRSRRGIPRAFLSGSVSSFRVTSANVREKTWCTRPLLSREPLLPHGVTVETQAGRLPQVVSPWSPKLGTGSPSLGIPFLSDLVTWLLSGSAPPLRHFSSTGQSRHDAVHVLRHRDGSCLSQVCRRSPQTLGPYRPVI